MDPTANTTYYIDTIRSSFDQTTGLQGKVDSALTALKNAPSDPQKLAEYQSALSEYNLYRNAQSNVVKAFKDIDAAIIQNFR
ncbi:type III secretion system needle complex protein [Chromobacterium sp. IIBBL 290-4]|uniref:type III secretion system needle complex protein n=1 Tax=Chromobacterium sp. IIBBL 290-4 TaxID=2953890 RepID=UPI0020B82676|nr:type III secretion system needle complex protein [Chromobacterium sp. IIBBL 290-4]UTH74115.1 type III secretion system needle complex protein [Chromobacterium sp. IIBBL 290-4]